MSGGSLQQHLPTMTWPQKISVMRDIAQGLAFLHSRGYLHRDLKSLNVLVERLGDTYQAKISDLGLSIPRSYDARNHREILANPELCGTPGWIAPELFKGAPFTPAADIFSLGMTFYECVEGESPYPNNLASTKQTCGKPSPS